MRLQPRGQFACRLRVVADVEHHVHLAVRHALQAPRERGLGYALREGLVGNRVARQRAQCGDRAGGVRPLGRGRQHGHRQHQFRTDLAPAPVTAVDGLVEEVAAQPERVRADRVGMAQHAGRRIHFAQHQRFPGTGDAGLLGTDGLAVRTQPVGVVDIDRGDHGHVGIDQVHRVESPPQADFEDRQVQARAFKKPQCGQGAEFEIRQRRVGARGFDRLERLDQ